MVKVIIADLIGWAGTSGRPVPLVLGSNLGSNLANLGFNLGSSLDGNSTSTNRLLGKAIALGMT